MARRPGPTCRHCKRRPAGPTAGLCPECYARPEVRLKHDRAVTPCRPPAPRPQYRPQKQPKRTF
jgi:hypothetical protein